MECPLGLLRHRIWLLFSKINYSLVIKQDKSRPGESLKH